MKKETKKVLITLFIMFIAVQAVGLYIGSKFIAMPEFPVEESPVYGAGIFLYILVATAVMLIVIKFVPQILKLFEVLAIFFSTEVFFEGLFMGVLPDGMLIIAGLGLAATITLLRVFHRTIITQNAAILLSITGVGALLGAYLGFLPALVLVGLLTVYDVIAVFKTKHMVTMAKAIVKQQVAFTMAIPTKKHVFQLGGGDLVMPLLLTVSVLRDFSLIAALFTMMGSMIALMVFFTYILERPGKAWPALPPVIGGAFVGLGVALLLGF